MRRMKLMKPMKLILLFVLFVFLMSLFTSTFVCALQESYDNSDESTTVSSRQRRGRCPFIRDSLVNGWVRMRNRGRIAKFTCDNGYDLIGNRVSTCIQGNWNNPLPACATRGCQRRQFSAPYVVEERWRGAVLDVSCQTGFSLSSSFSIIRIYCNSTHWKILGSNEDFSETDSDRYLCKSIESHFTTSEKISTNSSLNTAVTAKSETTTNSKFNSKMPEMTAMFVSPVININAMSTESTSLFADNSKTPITEPIDKSYTSTNATNIIQEVSTLTTTTTLRFNAFQTQISSTETTPKMNFTTLSEELSPNHTNYSTKLPQLIEDYSTQNSGPNASLISWPTTIQSKSMSPTSSSIPFTSIEDNLNSTPVPLILTSNPHLSTLITSLSSEQTTQPLPTSVTESSTEMKKSFASTLSSKSARNTNTERVLTTESMTSSTTIDLMVEKSTKPTIELEANGTSSPLITVSTNASISESIAPKMTTSSATFNEISQMIPEIKVTTALSYKNESSVKLNATKIKTIPNVRHSMVSTTRQSVSSSSMNSMKYSLFAENTTITPMRRRRQFSTKTSLVVTSIVWDNTERGLTISVAVISMTILVTILILYLIKRRKNTQQNRLSDDSEMRYLSSNEVF